MLNKNNRGKSVFKISFIKLSEIKNTHLRGQNGWFYVINKTKQLRDMMCCKKKQVKLHHFSVLEL